MLDPRQLAALCAVVETGGFDKAAKTLNLTQSAVSQRIRQLEEKLGQPVVSRTTPADATPAGRRLLQHFRQLQLMEGDLMQSLGPSDATAAFTELAIGVNADSLATWLLEAITPVVAARRVVLQIVMDDQDYTHELMRSGQVSGCISTRATPFQGGECHYLGTMRYLCLATPAFRDRYFAQGTTHTALAQAPTIRFSNKDDLHPQFLDKAAGYRGAFPHFTLPTPQGFVELTRRGLAYSLLPEQMIDDDLQTGRLVDLFSGQFTDLPLYWHHWRVESPIAQILTDALTAYCSRHLRQ